MKAPVAPLAVPSLNRVLQTVARASARGEQQREQREQHHSMSAIAAARVSVSEGRVAASGVASSAADSDVLILG
eukprot:396101-Lingulodinium_polyedra.AAC.1